MGQCVIIYGKSGSGKTRSLKDFESDEILFVNVEKKLPPFRKRFKYTLETDDVRKIKAWMKKMPMKIAVIDDAGYILTNTFMRGHSAGRKGREVYDLYNEIGDKFWGLFRFIKDELDNDVIVYVIMHEEQGDDGEIKLKTIGKLLDEKVNLPGMVTICLRCQVEEGKHFFRTSNYYDITKTPEEMFASDVIENNLKVVDETIREYYGWNTESEDDTNAEA